MPDTSSLIDASYALIALSANLSGRLIASALIPNVVIEEIITDTVRITDHPVETGCKISDHAFKMPVELVMRCGFSDSSGKFEGYSAQVWQFLIQLQNRREPFTVSTPKRTYEDMLISFLNVNEDEETSHALRINVGFRQIIITSTSSTPGPQNIGLIGSSLSSLPAFAALFGVPS